MRKEIAYTEDLGKIINQLPKGAFLTVRNGEEINTMTIGWASFGVIWNKPVLMVAVRKSRHTYSLMSNAKDFTVSVPINKDLSKELEYCGTHSGRNVNKIKECGLELKESNKVISPIIEDCDYHYECRVLFSQFMDSNDLEQSIRDRFYSSDDYHMLYFGEIVNSYIL